MLKRKNVIRLVALTSLIVQSAHAEENADNTIWSGFSNFFSPNWEEDFSATVGVKVWLNEWRRDSFFSDNVFANTPGGDRVEIRVEDSKPRAETSDLEATPIPQLSLRYKWLFITGSYYAKTDFDFDATERTRTVFINDQRFPLPVRDDVSAERYEYDFGGGVYIHQYVAILGGFKRIRQTIDITSTFNDGSTEKVRSDLDVQGPTIGIAGSVPIGRGFGMYANYAHGFMDVDIRDFNVTDNRTQDDVDRDADYDVAELGFTYTYGMSNLPVHMPLSSATVYAGYRWQNFETDNPGSLADRSDTTRGFVVGANLNW